MTHTALLQRHLLESEEIHLPLAYEFNKAGFHFDIGSKMKTIRKHSFRVPLIQDD